MKKIAGDIIILHMCSKNHVRFMYDVRFLRYGLRKAELFVILGHSFNNPHPTPSNDDENQNFEKK